MPREARVRRRADRRGADAANLEVVAAEIAFSEVDVRNGVQQVLRADNVLLGQAVRREGRNRHRHVLDGFFLALGRHDQRLDHIAGIIGRSRIGGEAGDRGRKGCGGYAQGEKSAQTQSFFHAFLPYAR